MKAIILAAGRGSRMGRLTDEQPKCLMRINEIPLIEGQIASLQLAGIQDIGIVTGYKAQTLQGYGTHRFHNPRWADTNMVHSLLCAQEWLQRDSCIVSYSDIFYGPKIIENLMKVDAEIAIAYDPNWLDLWSKRFEDPLDDAETFRINEDGYILEIGKKPKTIEEVQGQYMGLLKFEPSFWAREMIAIPLKMDMTSYLGRLLDLGRSVKGIVNEEAWGEVDRKEDVGVFGEVKI
jgi:choline kinase